jgi:DNA-directed RNA polymerase specialized sigma24 family protein
VEIDRLALLLDMLPRSQAFALRLCADLPPWADRDGILGDAYEALWQAILRYDPSRENKPSTYLLARVRGAVLDAMRAWGRTLDRQGEHPLPLDMPVDGDGVLQDLIPDPCAVDPAEAAERAESDRRVAAALLRLSPERRGDVVATVLRGEPLSSRARRTARYPSAVSHNRRLGLRQLAPILAGRPAPRRLPRAPMPTGSNGRLPVRRRAAAS